MPICIISLTLACFSQSCSEENKHITIISNDKHEKTIEIYTPIDFDDITVEDKGKITAESKPDDSISQVLKAIQDSDVSTVYKENGTVKGILIKNIATDTAASRVGVRSGDILKTVNGHPVREKDLPPLIRVFSAGSYKNRILIFERKGRNIPISFAN